MTLDISLRFVAASVALLAMTMSVLLAARVPLRREVAVAGIRAAVQLTAVALLIGYVFRNPQWAWAYLAVMLIAAAFTARTRVGLTRADTPLFLVAITAGTVATLAVVLLTGALPEQATTLLPFTAQIIGGSMIAASLAGSRFRDDVVQVWGEVEGWLALGAAARTAVAPMGRRALGRALTPAIDQTRSAGMVVLPGAFVGLLLGGASPAAAAQTQVLVLVGLLCAEAVAAAVIVAVLAPRFGATRPAVTID